MSSSHDCAWAEAVLLGEAPAPTGAEAEAALKAAILACPECAALAESLGELDVLAGSLPDLVVPPELSRRTLAQVQHEMTEGAAPPVIGPARSSGRRRSLLYVVGGLAMAAAATLVVMPQGPTPAPPERLVARGSATALPTVSLKMAVHDNAGLKRHRMDQQYPSGTRVQFRVGLDQSADVALLRVGADRTEVVTRTTLQQGDQDLLLGATPLAWEIEPGEESAHFVVLAAPAGGLPDDLTGIVAQGAGTVDAREPCAGVTALACDQRLLQVSP